MAINATKERTTGGQPVLTPGSVSLKSTSPLAMMLRTLDTSPACTASNRSPVAAMPLLLGAVLAPQCEEHTTCTCAEVYSFSGDVDTYTRRSLPRRRGQWHDRCQLLMKRYRSLISALGASTSFSCEIRDQPYLYTVQFLGN